MTSWYSVHGVPHKMQGDPKPDMLNLHGALLHKMAAHFQESLDLLQNSRISTLPLNTIKVNIGTQFIGQYLVRCINTEEIQFDMPSLTPPQNNYFTV